LRDSFSAQNRHARPASVSRRNKEQPSVWHWQLHGQARRNEKSGGQTTPDRELWLRAKPRYLGILNLSQDEIRKLGTALVAAYQYATWIRRELKNPHYQPSHETSAWTDYQQLFYLCDPTVHILYVDGDFTVRTGNSSQ